jgi:short-subunit dehydrogenase
MPDTTNASPAVLPPASVAASPAALRFRSRYGPWAVVTGATSGIGRATALHLAGLGLNLVLVARHRDALESLARTLEGGSASAPGVAPGVETRVVAADLSEAGGQGVRLLEEATADLDVGLLVAAAGFGTTGTFLDASLERELEMLALNGEAVLRSTHHFGRRFARRGKGGIVLFGSIVGFQGTPNTAHYAATKAYVQTLAEGLYLELAPRGVDVLSSAPGPVHTGFAERAGMVMGAATDPETVARVTLRALGRRPTTYPGLLTSVLTGSLAPLPRRMRSLIMGKVMGGMVRPPAAGA